MSDLWPWGAGEWLRPVQRCCLSIWNHALLEVCAFVCTGKQKQHLMYDWTEMDLWDYVSPHFPTRHSCVLFFNQSWQTCLFLTKIFESFHVLAWSWGTSDVVVHAWRKEKWRNKSRRTRSASSTPPPRIRNSSISSHWSFLDGFLIN